MSVLTGVVLWLGGVLALSLLPGAQALGRYGQRKPLMGSVSQYLLGIFQPWAGLGWASLLW